MNNKIPTPILSGKLRKPADFFAFTLSEVMIVLTIIGVLSAILIPVALHSMPDENVLKFKKANLDLYNAINELVTSDKYHLNGDLGLKPDGTYVDVTTDVTNTSYFCRMFSEVINAKTSVCPEGEPPFIPADATDRPNTWLSSNQDPSSIQIFKARLDTICKNKAVTDRGQKITTNNGVVYYESNYTYPFGTNKYQRTDNGVPVQSWIFQRLFYLYEPYICSKVFCMDIDGIPDGGSESCDDVKDICPFGYGITVYGKIDMGKRVEEWLNKSVEHKD